MGRNKNKSLQIKFSFAKTDTKTNTVFILSFIAQSWVLTIGWKTRNSSKPIYMVKNLPRENHLHFKANLMERRERIKPTFCVSAHKIILEINTRNIVTFERAFTQF